MFEAVWQGLGILALLGFVVASVYVLDRLKKAERRDASARLEVQEDSRLGNREKKEQ